MPQAEGFSVCIVLIEDPSLRRGTLFDLVLTEDAQDERSHLE
ncbi:MAG: hypothetical protein AAGB19_19960 [Cyanobacteria bacterium P01_F01_bin.3]